MSEKTLNLSRLQYVLDSALKEKYGTRREIAEALKIDTSTFTKVLNGSRQPSLDLLKRIVLLCGCTADYLLGVSDVNVPDTSIRGFCDYVKLPEKAIAELHLAPTSLCGLLKALSIVMDEQRMKGEANETDS